VTINGCLYAHPVVGKAVDEAREIFDRWLDGLHEDDRKQIPEILICSWERVAMIEMIAEALLARSGITDDALELFDEIYEHHCCDGVRDAALFELWDAERAKTPTETP
jgi:hypothetical protein